MLLILVRHGMTPLTGKRLLGWAPGHSLSELGREQAHQAAELLRGIKLSAIFSSPLERCAETADAIAQVQGSTVTLDPNIGEVRYGGWEGKPFSSLYKRKDWARLKAAPGDFRFPEGETLRETQARAMHAVTLLRERHRGKAVAIVSHADVVRLIVAGCLGLPIDLYARITISPGSVTAIWFDERGPHLLLLGATGSIAGLAELLRPKDSTRST